MPRGRKPNVEPSSTLNLALPETWRARLDVMLFSEVERRVPKGAYQRFFLSLLSIVFETEEMDLSPYAGSLPGELIIRGRPETLARLRAVLEK